MIEVPEGPAWAKAVLKFAEAPIAVPASARASSILWISLGELARMATPPVTA
jgi:hypothetical protein